MRRIRATDAAREIIAAVARQPSLRTPLGAALGAYLAEPIIAPIPLPPWSNAGMDGYAVWATDVASASTDAPVTLPVTAMIAAGDMTERELAPGASMRIFTGAKLPRGADSVIRQEDTHANAASVVITNPRDCRANIRPMGADLAAGSVALERGTRVGPAELGLLAALAVAQPMVHRRPRVGILSTGDEIVSLDNPDTVLAQRALGDVNSVTIAAMAQRAGGVPVPLGIAADDEDALHAIVSMASDVDLLVTAGGVSVGDHDHVRTVMARCGAVPRFDRIAMRPGGPTTFAMFPDGRAWLALAGNPVSAMVTFALFGVPAIRAMSGDRAPIDASHPVRLADTVRRDAVLEQHYRARTVSYAPTGMPTVQLTGAQGSGMLMSMIGAEWLVKVPAGAGDVIAGTVLEGIPL